MCKYDYIQSLSKLNRNIQKLFIQKLKLIGDDKYIKEFEKTVSNDEGQNEDTSLATELSISDVFRQALLVIQTYNNVDLDFMYAVFYSLKLIAIDYPEFNRIKMDSQTKDIYQDVIDKIKGAPDSLKEKLLNELISCRNSIFKIEN